MFVHPVAEAAVFPGEVSADGENRPVTRKPFEMPIKCPCGRHGSKAFQTPMRAHLLDQVLAHYQADWHAEGDTLLRDHLPDWMRTADQDRIPASCLLGNSAADFEECAGAEAPELIQVRIVWKRA